MPRYRFRLFAITLVAMLTLTAPLSAAPLSPEQLQALTQKAEQGDMGAQSDLADRYHSGDGVTRDDSRAAFWYTKLADQGVAQAQLTLALMYIRGEGLEQDDTQALHWLTLAAEQRLALAQYLVGVAHAEGHGVERDPVKAYMWYEIAAAMDYQNAVAARADLASKLNQEQIRAAEKMATDWWMKFHH